MRNLNSNLAQDSTSLTNELLFIHKTEYTANDFLKKINSGILSETDSSGFLIRRLIVAPEFHPNSATFEAIKSTGDLKLIDDDSLSQFIMNLYEVTYEELGFLIGVYNQTSMQTLWNYSIDNHDLTKVLGPSKDRIYKLDLPTDQDRKLLVNKIMFTKMSINYTIFRMENSLDHIRQLRQKIRMRLSVI